MSGDIRFGAMMIMAGMAGIGMTDSLVELIARDVGLFQLHLLRSAMALPILWLTARLLGLPLSARRPGRVAVRSVLFALSMLLYFASLPVMPIAQAAAGLFTAPLWVLLFSAIWTRRRVGPRRILAVLLGFGGALVTLRPEAQGLGWNALMPAAAGMIYALASIATREWLADEPVAVVLGGAFAVMGLAGALGLGLLAALPPLSESFVTQGWATPTPRFWALTAVQAVGALMALGCLIKGYQSADTSFLSSFEYSFLIFASFWSWLIYGRGLAAADMLGLAMIIGSGVLIALSHRSAAVRLDPAAHRR